MARGKRAQSESGMYHVFARGVSRCLIFEDDEDRREFVGLLGKFFGSGELRLHAWCLMDNHYHLLVDCGELGTESLSAAMRDLNSSYATFFNSRHGRVGHLFQDRFRSEKIVSNEHFLEELRYIHQNPVKAHLSKTCEYPWSSYNGYLTSPWLVDNEPAASLFGSYEEFIRFHAQYGGSAACSRLERSGRGSADESEMVSAARDALGSIRLEEVSGLGREARDAALRLLKDAHFSLRQIERLTGVPKSVVARA